MNRCKKIILSIILFIIMILVSTNVFAISSFDFWHSTPIKIIGTGENALVIDGGDNVDGVSAYASFSKSIDGKEYQFFCIGHLLWLAPDDLLGYEGTIGDSSKYFNGDEDSNADINLDSIKRGSCVSSDCDSPCDTDHGYTRDELAAEITDEKTGEVIKKAEIWEGTRETAYYKFCEYVALEDYQDLAYIVSARDRNGRYLGHEEFIQYYIWANNINEGSVKEDEFILDESIAYQQFYEAIHDDEGNDTYKDTVEDVTDYSKVVVSVDRTQRKYTVGPFQIKYLDKTDINYGPYSARYGYDSDTNHIFDYTNINSKLSGLPDRAYRRTETEYDGERIDFNKITKINLYDQYGNLINDTKIIRETPEYEKDEEYAFPKSQEKFWIEFPYQGNEKVTAITMKVEFEYIEKCIAEMAIFRGTRIGWTWETKEGEPTDCHTEEDSSDCSDPNCTQEGPHTHSSTNSITHTKNKENLVKSEGDISQPLVAVAESERIIKNYEIEMCVNIRRPQVPGTPGTPGTPDNPPPDEEKEGIPLTMQLGGFVFLDAKTGKASQVNDILDKDISVDQLMKGIQVTLYEYDEATGSKKIAKLTQEYEEVKRGSASYNAILSRGTEIRTNPTLTDENGQYVFKGLNAMKVYYVEFSYNGQIYTSSKYKATVAGKTDKENWEINSKATEGEKNRQNFNNQFAEIGSYPCNYAIVGKVLYPANMVQQDGKYYNIGFQTEEVDYIYEKIAEKIQEYIDNSPSKDSMGRASYPDIEKDIYPQILSIYANDSLIRNKLQFIEDCKIKSYTGSDGQDKLDLYPRYDKFVIDYRELNLNNHKLITVDKVTGKILEVKDYNKSFTPIYPEQFYINQGIKLRGTVDLALYKDVFQARVTINGMEEIYKYNKRVEGGKEFSLGVNYGDIVYNYNNPEPVQLDDEILEVRYRDIKVNDSNINDSGYAGNYHLTDEEKLHIWVTYKVAIENQSATTSAVTELVDYYDSKYGFTTAYVGDDNGNHIADVEARQNSKYGEKSQINSNRYKTVYLEIPEIRIDNNERTYVYVVLELLNAPETLSEVAGNSEYADGERMETTNLVEINGYKTFNSKSDGRTPGLIDIDSKPGTFKADEYVKGVTEFEDDENPAPAFMYVKRKEERSYHGTVFEDSTADTDKIKTGEAREGDGKYEQGEKTIQGVLVELVEYKNGNEEVRARNYTDANGNYVFNHYLAGNYIVRYVYGQEDKTALTKDLGGLNDTSYNGQDYQSTVIRSDLYEYNQPEDILKTKDANNQKYWYALVEKDSKGKIIRYSDAIDKYGNVTNNIKELTIQNTPIGTRSHTIAYSSTMNNYITRVLSSHEYNMTEENRKLIEELKQQTYMTAYTPKMVLEIEKARPTIDSRDDKGYTVNDVDFGIVERPRSLIQILKQIENITIKTQEGEDFIVNGGMSEFVTGNVLGVQAIETKSTIAQSLLKIKKAGYTINPYYQGFVNIVLDEERMRGATIEITYKIIAENLSELDYVMGNYNDKYKVPENLVKTTVNTIVDYVNNNLKIDTTIEPNSTYSWQEVINPATNTQIINDDPTKTAVLYEDREKTYQENVEFTRKILKDYNSIAVTSNTNTQELAPGETFTPVNLKLSQVLTQTSDSDAFVYENNLEIINTSNTVGRRNYVKKSVVGNFNPETKPNEPDTGETEKIIITPPTGEQNYIPIIAYAGTMLVILMAGIIIIKKKVLR